MHAADHSERFQDLFAHPAAVDFCRRMLSESYVEAAPGHEGPMRALMEQAWDLLEESLQDERRFSAAVVRLSTEVFCKQDPGFWFNRVYRHYKRTVKPPRRRAQLLPLLSGRRVLDLGCGDGLTSLALHQAGYQVLLADILDYRDETARSLPFRPMAGPAHIPYPDDGADTAVVIAVLHHIEPAHLGPLLADIRRVCHRAVIEEDSYGIPPDLPGLDAALAHDAQLRDFLALSPADQHRALMFIDYFANAIAQGLPQMAMPFNFRTIPQWWACFADEGWQVEQTLLLGFQKAYYNRSCHVWFVLEAA